MSQQNLPAKLEAPAVPRGDIARAVFVPASLGQAMELARIMASGRGVRPGLRDESICLMLVTQAVRWGLDPYAVAHKAYETNGNIAYEAQLVNAVVNTSPMLARRPRIEWEGEATGGKGNETLVCRVTGWLRDEPENGLVLEQAMKDVTVRNSPLWAVNPRQQLGYFTTRAWARLYIPEVLLGVYTPDEYVDGETAQIEQRTQPARAAAPRRADFEATATQVEDDDGPEEAGRDDSGAPIEAEFEEAGEEPAGEDEGNLHETQNAPPADEPRPQWNVDRVGMPSSGEEWDAWMVLLQKDLKRCSSTNAVDRLRYDVKQVQDAAPEERSAEIDERLFEAIADLAADEAAGEDQ